MATGRRRRVLAGAAACVAMLLFAGCATALKREGRCLASLTPDYLTATTELHHLERSWRAALVRPAATASLQESPGEAYRKLADARTRHQPTLDWYGKVYDRVRTRMSEEDMLSGARMVLLTNAGIIWYPVVRWNVRSVVWDGADPDSEADPVTQFCAERLAHAPLDDEAPTELPPH